MTNHTSKERVTMSNTPHELAEEFPEHTGKMHDLCASDAHFSKLFEEYHTVNRAVHTAETDVKPTSDDHISDLRKERMRLKDQVHAYLTKK
jgi:uncharacterized protein YdcH (DUF465 family)